MSANALDDELVLARLKRESNALAAAVILHHLSLSDSSADKLMIALRAMQETIDETYRRIAI